MSMRDWQNVGMTIVLYSIAFFPGYFFGGMDGYAAAKENCKSEPVRGLTQEEMDYVPGEALEP